MKKKLREAGAEPPPLRFDCVESIARDPETTSKLKLVRSEPTQTDDSTG